MADPNQLDNPAGGAGTAPEGAQDPVFQEEQEHLTGLYRVLLELRDELRADVESDHFGAAQDLINMSEEVALNLSGYDEALETYAAIETLNSVIDAYNLQHDMNVDKLRRALLLLAQPYFAKVSLVMRPGRPPRDVYIGAAGITDDHSVPLVVDWRSPVAETYYNQEMGETSYEVNGRKRTVELKLRRQFDITRDKLNGYFDTTVAIQDSLLLQALGRRHTEKLRAITATIQREQNLVVRHEDVPVLLVNGIAGSGKTSVLLQRIAFLLYRERGRLSPDQVWLFTPNRVFENYIDRVLPSMGEANPRTFTWRAFMESQGAGSRGAGSEGDAEALRELERAVPDLEFQDGDLRAITFEEATLVSGPQVRAVVDRCARICRETGVGIGPRFTALVKEGLSDRFDAALAKMARNDELQEKIASMDIDEKIHLFGQAVAADEDADLGALAREMLERHFGPARDQIEDLSWLRLDRIAMRLLGVPSPSAPVWLYLKLLLAGSGDDAARYVMVDEVQDYTAAQLMVLARFFPLAHFMLLGDRNQAIFEGSASFPEIADIFRATHGEVSECRLLTSYRSSPEITGLFCSLLPADEKDKLASVQSAGVEPQIRSFDDTDEYLEAMRGVVRDPGEGLCAIVAASDQRVAWLARQLPSSVVAIGGDAHLPAEGVVLVPLRIAKGLEFDHVVIPDAQAEVYPDDPLHRRRLYTAISRATHRVTVFSQGPLTPMLAR